MRGFEHPEPELTGRELMRGHSTAPGPRDDYEIPAGDARFADGTPGEPRLRPTPMTHGPGVPGTSPGPKEMEIWSFEEDELGGV